MPELITEVDRSDGEIGARPKTDFFTNHELICRTSHLYLFNSKRQLLMQLRAKNRKNYPNQYDASVSGTVRAGETYNQALEREMKEELGICIPATMFIKGFYEDDIHRSHKMCFWGMYDGPIEIQKSEIAQILWIDRTELKKKMAEEKDKFCPPFLEELHEIIQKNYLIEVFT
ncbi:MAG: NUDIX domain-containing protein [Candidatus Magasanikbacteria bacterium]